MVKYLNIGFLNIFLPVFEIMLGVSSGVSWPDIILKTLPQRKGCKPKVPKQNKPENAGNIALEMPLDESKEFVDQPMDDLKESQKMEQMEISENCIPANLEQAM